MIPVILLFVASISAVSFFSPATLVEQITPENLSEVENSDFIWLVKFYIPTCKRCVDFAPEYERLARALKGVAKVGVVDASKYEDIAEKYNVKTFPTIKLLSTHKRQADTFDTKLSLDNLVERVLENIQGKILAQAGKDPRSGEVIELNDDTFDDNVIHSKDAWLVEFYAPWCGHCKALTPEWSTAAKELQSKVKLGAIDATVNNKKAAEYGIRGYPTIKYFPAGSKDKEKPLNYEGGRSSSEIVNWAKSKADTSDSNPGLHQITDEYRLKRACEDANLCLVSFLPQISDCHASCRNRYLDLLKDMSSKYKENNWGWVWTEAGAQPEIEAALDVTSSGYPAMAAVNVKKRTYALLKGPFSSEKIDNFVEEVEHGRGNNISINRDSLPKVNEVKYWDGDDSDFNMRTLKEDPVSDDKENSEEISLEDVGLDSREKDEL